MIYDIETQEIVTNDLQSKPNFDRVDREIKKPEELTSGLLKQDSVQESLLLGTLNNSIVTKTPNFHKGNGVIVSKIPYLFETPIPQYFRNKGLFKNENTWKFVSWAFSKCSNQSYTIEYENFEIHLQPYEFICGRKKSSSECFLTEKEFRGQLNFMINRGLIQKRANSRANRYSIYMWVTEAFSNIKGQPKGPMEGQPRANRGPQSSRVEDIEDKEDHLSISSFSDDRLIDDLFSKEEEKNKILFHNGKYHEGENFSVYLTQEDLDECLKCRGSAERIKDIIEQVAAWPGRKYEIKDWVKTIKEWKFKNVAANRSAENEEVGKKIHDIYSESKGWSARIYRDMKKDQRGILFEGQGANCQPLFVSFSEANFKERCLEIIKTKKMKKKGES